MDPSDRKEELSPVKRALLELREMRARLDAAELKDREPIAIVGMSCRFPGADSPEAFWELLQSGRSAISEVPRDRWPLAEYFDQDPDAPGKMYTRHGGFLSDIDRFDARFFGITPREAERLDPQQRLLLEVAWEAIERAGIAAERLMGEVAGVFIGMSGADYLQLQLKSGDPGLIDAYLASGGSSAVASGRLAYTLGLQGPALTVDTACSSSLTAVHLACQSLRQHECRVALAGGVSLILMPELSINFSKARMMAPDGRCKTFDAAADGYVRSEGCGIVVLKRLADAEAGGDRILAVIRGSAVNQDGRSSGLTVPNGPAQEAVIREALRRGSLEPADVDYVEAHGTGTSLGDPIEVRALGSVFNDRGGAAPLAIGSVKTNVGHLEAAAGIAGVIKVVLAMQHGAIPPHLHFETPTPHVPWETLPISVPTSVTTWPERSGRRVAGVSSFGFSGTNAHVVLETAPVAEAMEVPAGSALPVHVLPLSARSAPALRAMAARLAAGLEPSVSLADVGFSAGVTRSHFPHRLAVVCDSIGAAKESLTAFANSRPSAAIEAVYTAPAAPEVAFLFTGQGAQYVGMGQALYESEPAFRRRLDQCDEMLRPILEQPLLDVLFGRNGAGSLIDQTGYTQPALFALEYALFELWKSWGVEPSIVMGHSLGEDVAACAAGVFSFEDGLQLIAARGRLMQNLPRLGEMHVVFASEDRVRRVLAGCGDEIAVAAINGPEHVTVSGHSRGMQQALAAFASSGFKTKPIPTSHAFHSPLMDPMLADYEARAAQVRYRPAQVPLVSNVSAAVATNADLGSPAYWRRHVRESVRFGESIAAIWDRGCRLFVEIGPGATLLGMAQRNVPEEEGVWLASLRKGRDDWREMLTSLATLYTRGIPINWENLHRESTRRRVALPTYPFQRERYWAPLRAMASATSAGPTTSRWESTIEAAEHQASTGPLDLAVETYGAKWERLNLLAVEFMTAALRGFGLFTLQGEAHTAEEVRQRAGIADTYRTLVQRWLEALVKAGRLVADGSRFRAEASLPSTDLDALVAASEPMFRDYPSALEYIVRCGRSLNDVLTGRETALETLFPGGSTRIADALYGTSPLARYYNGIVRAVAVAAAAQSTPDRPLRILEIGGGTGGTTTGLLPALPADRARYCFTDVGPLFLSRARERFSTYRFMTYRLLDIEKSPQDQGLPAGGFDMIVAANVLHATSDLHRTLEHARSLLDPAGVLVLYEATNHPTWFDVTTGLISGWQRFADDLRTDVPLIAPATWKRALLAHGFDAVAAFPDTGTPAAVFGQHVIIARANGVAVAREGEQPAVEIETDGEAAPDAAALETAAEFAARLSSLPASDQHDALVEFVRERVVRVLRLDPSQPPASDQRLMDLGIDSLMAVEFRNMLAGDLGAGKLPATLIFDYPTIDAVAEYLKRTVFRQTESAATEPVAPQSFVDLDRTAASLEELDDDEVEALLAKRLESL